MTYSGFFNNLLLVSGVILIGGIIAFFVVTRLLKLLFRRMEQRDRRGVDFDMLELFDLHQQGQLTAEEYERAKQTVLARRSRPADSSAPPDTERGFAVLPAGRQPAAPPAADPPPVDTEGG